MAEKKATDKKNPTAKTNKTNKKSSAVRKDQLKDKNNQTKQTKTKKDAPKQTQKQSAKTKKKQAEQPKQKTQNKKTKTQAAKGQTTGKKGGSNKKTNSEKVRIAFLGGINEVGKNMTLYEYGDDMFIVDCGLAFPDQDMPGVDLVIPDFTYIEKNAEKIRGVVITHGHEDHIGALAYLLKSVNTPVFGTRLSIGLIEGKLKEHGMLNKVILKTVEPGDEITLGKFSVEFIHVNHSIPDAVGLAIKSPAGVIVQTGDFKIDCTPIDGGMIDIARFAQLGSNGVLALLSDSTNAERPGFTESEKIVGESFERLFRRAGQRRIIVATFASNIHRVQQIIDVAESLGRKVALSGRSLENVVAIGAQLGYLKVPENILISIDMINRYSPEQLVLITTGSQGEPMSALTRMAFSDHRKVSITPNDYVIISANPIPGNERMVGNVINELMRLGAEVVYEKMYDVHVSGHACQEELKIMLGIVKPKYFIPVHGEQKHLQKHAKLGVNMGIDKNNIMIVENGCVLELSESGIKKLENVQAGQVFVDGSGVGDVGSVVIRDRKHLSNDGLIIVVATIDSVTGEILSGPDVVSRGFVYVREAEELMDEARKIAFESLSRCQTRHVREWNTIKSRIRDDVSKLMYERTKRSPMILPIIMEV
ncbi:MAG: RNase J family beta-CASP ribonuclease [Acutalibacteraceae bacterium]